MTSDHDSNRADDVNAIDDATATGAANATGNEWYVNRSVATVAAHHAHEFEWRRSVLLLAHVDRAIAIGSTQKIEDIDTEATESLGISVVRRRSGGGAVFLDPVGAVWIDVVIPRHDSLWVDDVSLSALWLGEAWLEALQTVGVTGAAMHRGAMMSTPMSRTICFDGLAPGEVVVDGCKVVGISQRRTRDGARFQCVIHRAWEPAMWRDCLRDSAARAALDDVAVASVDIDPARVFAALGAAIIHS